MKKKILAGLLGVIMALSLTACGSGKTYTQLKEGLKSQVVTLGEYKNLEYSKPEVTITDEEVEAELLAEMEWYTEYKEIERTTVEEGDIVNIDFVGKIDGVEFEDGSAEAYDLEIGAGDFIEGFEEQLIGKEKGASFTINVTFPDDYSEELGGKEAEFDVTINKIQEAVVPELTDEFVQENLECETVDEYRAQFKEDLLAMKEEEAASNAILSLMEQIIAGSELKIEQSDIDSQAEAMTEDYRAYADMYGMEFEDFVQDFFGYTVEELTTENKTYAEEEIRDALILSAIAEKEKLGITQKEYEAEVTASLEEYECESIEEYEELYGKEDVIYSMLYDKVTNYLLENSKNTAAQ